MTIQRRFKQPTEGGNYFKEDASEHTVEDERWHHILIVLNMDPLSNTALVYLLKD